MAGLAWALAPAGRILAISRNGGIGRPDASGNLAGNEPDQAPAGVVRFGSGLLAAARSTPAIAGLAVSSRWKSSRNSFKRRQREVVTKAPRFGSPPSMAPMPKKSPVLK